MAQVVESRWLKSERRSIWLKSGLIGVRRLRACGYARVRLRACAAKHMRQRACGDVRGHRAASFDGRPRGRARAHDEDLCGVVLLVFLAREVARARLLVLIAHQQAASEGRGTRRRRFEKVTGEGRKRGVGKGRRRSGKGARGGDASEGRRRFEKVTVGQGRGRAEMRT